MVKAKGKKPVAIVIRRSPLNTTLACEGLRQAVGLTLADLQVNVYLIGEGARLAAPLPPQVIGGEMVGKHLEALAMLGARVVTAVESLEGCDLSVDSLPSGIEVTNRQGVAMELAQAQVAYAF